MGDNPTATPEQTKIVRDALAAGFPTKKQNTPTKKPPTPTKKPPTPTTSEPPTQSYRGKGMGGQTVIRKSPLLFFPEEEEDKKKKS